VAAADSVGWSVNMNLSRSCFRRDNGSSIIKCTMKRLMTQNEGTANNIATLIMITIMIVTCNNNCVCNIGKKLTEVTGDPMETSYLFQRLSFAIHRGNDIFSVGTLSDFVIGRTPLF